VRNKDVRAKAQIGFGSGLLVWNPVVLCVGFQAGHACLEGEARLPLAVRDGLRSRKLSKMRVLSYKPGNKPATLELAVGRLMPSGSRTRRIALVFVDLCRPDERLPAADQPRPSR
jgi:hypothetical protein